MAGKSKRPVRAAARQPTEKKKNLLASLGLDAVDYKDTGTLRVFISERGKIRSRRVMVARYAQRRAELKEIIRSPASTPEQRVAAQQALARQPRDASATRLRNRDAVDGRPRGHLRKFGLSRVRMRELAHQGQLPGIRKASW